MVSVMKKSKVGIITMGCPKNLVDSEKLAAMLAGEGFEVEHEQADADIIIINTCGFINDAKEESINEILNHTSRKNANKNLKVIVTGCLTERYREDLKKEIPEADVFFGVNEYDKVVEYITGKSEKLQPERILGTPAHYAYLKISEGCNRTCSFCAIPLIRGQHVSVPEEELLKETELLALQGVKELIVIAQDTVSYGLDLYGERRIARLLRKLSEIKGIQWIRLMYTYPAGFPDDLIEEIAVNPKIVKYIDLPLQHISTSILHNMKRSIDRESTEALVSKIRSRIPDVAIRSTFIVGYPGEKASDYTELVQFIKESKFERFGVFAYSPEESTAAFLQKDNIPHKTKMLRMSGLLRYHEKASIEFNKKLVGKTLPVIVDEYNADEKCFYGRTPIDAPEIDNIVRLFVGSDHTLKPGDIVEAKVISSGIFDIDCEF
ncbi:MAG: ribosomal protein S12 methylthiotransferase RimO [Bacteroidetes bacterium GWF2_43_63]|nr:MAG: ribosomal protein S12 methylthiotransferase RimO [Bacteroidetes bacterium GWE2_42_42]OFY55142.1 MAG: ribosomal protein S12 methylthiotransferase RimO [Bacteroidetes bacterium GWF2_43_63]HBG70238.1 30S ribosomal protein S12 methylthiotransferase RimO [Bacteroidales bacterium]HCB63090.1 30S ribosomal protein S12 methylthiotransferase RimO [Bacteroidales bacterium]HCY22691.1 30S ribosomal protein S12 methylthiotransferase RimO [Bacteroidales bacterium]